MSLQSFKKRTKRPQETPKMQHKRPMPKIRIRNLQGHSKEDLRQKGAAAVFGAACSINRKRSRNQSKMQPKIRSNFDTIFNDLSPMLKAFGLAMSSKGACKPFKEDSECWFFWVASFRGGLACGVQGRSEPLCLRSMGPRRAKCAFAATFVSNLNPF